MPYNNAQSIPVIDRWFGSWQIRIGRRPLATEALASAYDREAPTWTELTNRLGYPTSYRRVFEQFLDRHALESGDAPLRVLDCGVGTGSLSLALDDVLNKPMALSAVDISPSMVQRCQERFATSGLTADVRVASVAQLPYSDHQFDLVIAAHVLEHLPNPIEALAEIRRVLKPGGWVVSCLTRRSWLGTYIQTKWRTHRVSPVDAQDWLRRAGFQPRGTLAQPNGLFRYTSLTAVGQNTIAAANKEETQR
ncbi:MAG: class I SAM-dependent methyltransferase [Pseudomonadota bacterium]